MRILNVIPVLAAGVVLSAVAADAGKSSAQMAMPLPSVWVDQVKPGHGEVLKKYVGMVKAVDDVTLIARVSGEIIKQAVPHGASVKKGDLLFVIEDVSYRAAVDSARAKVKQCEAELAFAKLNFDRNDKLIKQHAVAESAYEESVRVYDIAKAQLNAAQAALVTAEDDLKHTRVLSPVDGRMGRGFFSPGNYVRANTSELCRLVSYDPIYVDFAISERDYLKYFRTVANVKQNADITLQLADGSFYGAKADDQASAIRGKVYFVDNRADTNTDTLLIRAVLPNPDHALIPGGLCTVHLGQKDAGEMVTIPVTAMMIAQDGCFVYVLGADNMPQRRRVVPGPSAKGVQVITSGLKAGETVIVDGTHKVMPGLGVKPVQVGAPRQEAVQK